MNMTRSWKRLAGAVLIAVTTIGTASGCVTNPATGKSSLNLIDEQREIAIGLEAEPQFIDENGGLVESQRLRNYVTKLGMELAAVSERPHLPWSFNVLDSDQINAFALPGGKVFMSRGLLEKMTNEAQLAGVLGHEVGHVTAQHVNSRMSQGMVVQLGVLGATVFAESSDAEWLKAAGPVLNAGGGVYLLKFGRDQESESDMLGVRYMTKLGYNPYGQVQVMQILKEAQGGGAGPEFFATHPLPQTRIDRLEKLIAEQYPGVTQSAGGNSNYRFGEASFKANVLDELAKLGPAKAADIGPMLEQYLVAVHAECDHGHGHHDHDHASTHTH